LFCPASGARARSSPCRGPFTGPSGESAAFRKSNFSSICPLGDKSGEGNTYINMGVCMKSLGKVQEVIEMYKKTLEISQQAGEY
jgi:hypothetical protein